MSASDTHNRKNVNRSTEESLDDIAAILDLAHGRGATCQVIVSTAWGCPYEGDVPVERVLAVAGRALADGADTLSYGDTTGMATPGRVTRLVGETRSAFPDAALNLHFHNTRGTGLANVLAALELGVSDFDASVGGLGGCPYAPGRDRQHRHRGAGAHGGGHGGRHRHRPGGHDRRRGAGRDPGRAHPAVAGPAGRSAHQNRGPIGLSGLVRLDADMPDLSRNGRG